MLQKIHRLNWEKFLVLLNQSIVHMQSTKKVFTHCKFWNNSIVAWTSSLKSIFYRLSENAASKWR